jgi:hypothetical protein
VSRPPARPTRRPAPRVRARRVRHAPQRDEANCWDPQAHPAPPRARPRSAQRSPGGGPVHCLVTGDTPVVDPSLPTQLLPSPHGPLFVDRDGGRDVVRGIVRVRPLPWQSYRVRGGEREAQGPRDMASRRVAIVGRIGWTKSRLRCGAHG